MVLEVLILAFLVLHSSNRFFQLRPTIFFFSTTPADRSEIWKWPGQRLVHVAPFRLRNSVWVSTPRLLLLQLLLPLSLFFTYHAPSCLNGTHVERSSVTAATTAGHTSRRKKMRQEEQAFQFLSRPLLSLSRPLSLTLICSRTLTHTPRTIFVPFLSSQLGRKKESNVHASKQPESSHWEDFSIPATLSLTFHQFVLLVLFLISVSAT